MARPGDRVVIFWYYRRMKNGQPDPYSIDAQTGIYRGKNHDGDDIIMARDGRTYAGTLCPEYNANANTEPENGHPEP